MRFADRSPIAFFVWRVILFCLFTPVLCRAGMHPVWVDAHSNCLECHADRATGAYVHGAVKQGCTVCHSIEERDDATYVTMKQSKSIVCNDCHAQQRFSMAHFPYASAMCLRCHDPHTSADPQLLKTKVNDLCLQCHLRTPTSIPSQNMPTITLTLNNTMGHPYERHPVSGVPDPLTGNEMSCASCHLAHGGAMLHHLKMGSEIPEDALNQNTETKDMCHKCHLRLWGLDGDRSKKKKKR
jgi:predicted CXXCH cytochrome family protein